MYIHPPHHGAHVVDSGGVSIIVLFTVGFISLMGHYIGRTFRSSVMLANTGLFQGAEIECWKICIPACSLELSDVVSKCEQLIL